MVVKPKGAVVNKELKPEPESETKEKSGGIPSPGIDADKPDQPGPGNISSQPPSETPMQGKPSDPETGIATQFAACLYYYDHGTKQEFATLNAEELKPYYERALAILAHVDKMNLVFRKKIDSDEIEAAGRKNVEILTQIIRNFVKTLKTTKPELFPAEELAHKILHV